MSTRQAILVAMLAFTAFFAGLTLYVIARKGLDVLTLCSLAVLALFVIAIVGALREPPEE
jgi:hypothetical protein